MRAVLDANVIISALLSRDGAPARIFRAWVGGEFELVVSPLLLEELERALRYPKLARRVDRDEAVSFLAWLRRSARLEPDPESSPSRRSRDPGDDYLLALAERQAAYLVSGDEHLLELAADAPIVAPNEFLEMLAETPR